MRSSIATLVDANAINCAENERAHFGVEEIPYHKH